MMASFLNSLVEFVLPLLLALVGISTCFAGWVIRQNRRLVSTQDQVRLESLRLGNLIWATNSGTWEWQVQTGELAVNDRWAEILGVTKDELNPITIQSWLLRVHPDEQTLSADMIKRCLNRTVEHYKCEMRLRHASGDWVWVLIHGRVVEWGPDGNALRMVGSIGDISERKYTTQRDTHRSRVLQMLATDCPLEVVLEAIARDIKDVDPKMLCSISMSDPNGILPFVTAAPDLPDYFVFSLDSFARRQNRYIGVDASKDVAIAHDISTNLSWAPFADIAARAGLRSCWAQPIVSVKGQLLGTFCIFHRSPCTPTAAQLQWLEDEARLSGLAIERSTAVTRQQLAASVFTHAREGIIITDLFGNIVDANETFTQITGYTREDAIGNNSRLLQSGAHDEEFFDDMWLHLTNEGHWSGEIWNRRKNGDLFAQMTTISAVCDGTGSTSNFVALFTDITAYKNHQRQLEHIAHYDALTGLPNRVLLADRLAQGIAHSQRHNRSMAVAYLDLDGFKAVNDSHGHKFGDELLIEVSKRMKSVMRDTDTLSRIGGDEFVAVMVDLEKHRDTEVVLARLLTAASDPVHVGGKVLHVSSSIGVTVYPDDFADADMLMRHADQAMYSAKQAGKNRVHWFDVAHDAAIQMHHENLCSLTIAIQRNELVLHYQPKVNLRTSEVVGLEALLRWQHPQKGLLAPAEFLNSIETHPVSIAIGEWVIESALCQISEWQRVNLVMPVSVNVGALQLQQPDFFDRIQSLLSKYPDVSPHLLEFEILETSALKNIGTVSEVMHSFHKIGIGFSLDDFGTGYSSLSYLKHLPAATLKIDQTFTRNMLSDGDDLSIVKSIIGLTSEFNRHVIAEGVETEEHCRVLMSLGCDFAQGYGIARPMPSNEVLRWLVQWYADSADRLGRTRQKPKLLAA